MRICASSRASIRRWSGVSSLQIYFVHFWNFFCGAKFFKIVVCYVYQAIGPQDFNAICGQIRIKQIFNFRSKLCRNKKLEIVCYFRFFSPTRYQAGCPIPQAYTEHLEVSAPTQYRLLEVNKTPLCLMSTKPSRRSGLSIFLCQVLSANSTTSAAWNTKLFGISRWWRT